MQTSGKSGLDFEFLSSIKVECIRDLEALLFFHPRQQLLKENIRNCITEFGTPEILRRAGQLYVGIPRNGAQGLFACQPVQGGSMPMGIIVYLRTSRELLRILHLAVHPAYEHDGAHPALGLGLLLIEEVRNSARLIAGIRSIQLPYMQESFLSVPPLSAVITSGDGNPLPNSLPHHRAQDLTCSG